MCQRYCQAFRSKFREIANGRIVLQNTEDTDHQYRWLYVYMKYKIIVKLCVFCEGSLEYSNGYHWSEGWRPCGAEWIATDGDAMATCTKGALCALVHCLHLHPGTMEECDAPSQSLPSDRSGSFRTAEKEWLATWWFLQLHCTATGKIVVYRRWPTRWTIWAITRNALLGV